MSNASGTQNRQLLVGRSSAARRRAFTLIEMLLATVLAGLLMGGVLLMTTAVGRDRAKVAAEEKLPRGTCLVDQFRWDLTNATTITQLDNGHGMLLVGHGGLDAKTLSPTGRLTRVIYEVRGSGPDAALFRRQDYLDDPVRPESWTELVAPGVLAIRFMPETDAEPVAKEKPLTVVPTDDEPAATKKRHAPQAYYVATRGKLLIQRPHSTIDTELWLR